MPTIPGYTRMTKIQRYSAAGITAAGAAALALTVVPGSADAGDASQSTANKSISAEPVSFSAQSSTVPTQREGIGDQMDVAEQRAKAEAAAQKRAAEAKQDEAQKKAAADAKKEREAKAAANRSSQRAAVKSYPNNLDGWIREARDIMKKHNIPGSYEGIKRNIIRESGGDPNVVNDWDINAKNGVPSKGLLQVIQPTFDAYHVDGTKDSLTDPVANIVAACNYAADRYGSMDNVNSAY
ncbi:transglycosylase SLT domain-containing protein [Streptomyces sp. NPDC054796]|uniref:Transglycosylase SLT domain-containing protein n=1 Tax=Streptomyces daliensis TaxID=299421 RepID=A0A8T4IYA4_9ACTN|nr:transglycosylase SLT domain-containing protein [Streptomyces daliensis]